MEIRPFDQESRLAKPSPSQKTANLINNAGQKLHCTGDDQPALIGGGVGGISFDEIVVDEDGLIGGDEKRTGVDDLGRGGQSRRQPDQKRKDQPRQQAPAKCRTKTHCLGLIPGPS